MLHTYHVKTLKPDLAKYAVDANLFRLGPTNPKKNPRRWMLFGGGQAPHQKKLNFFSSNMFEYLWTNIFFPKMFFFQKYSNLHENSRIGWIERKNKFQILPTSSPQFAMNFHDNSINKNRKTIVFRFPSYSVQCASYIITGIKNKEGEGFACRS